MPLRQHQKKCPFVLYCTLCNLWEQGTRTLGWNLDAGYAGHSKKAAFSMYTGLHGSVPCLCKVMGLVTPFEAHTVAARVSGVTQKSQFFSEPMPLKSLAEIFTGRMPQGTLLRHPEMVSDFLEPNPETTVA